MLTIFFYIIAINEGEVNRIYNIQRYHTVIWELGIFNKKKAITKTRKQENTKAFIRLSLLSWFRDN